MSVEPIEPVVVGVDGSPASMAAIDLAADEALARVAPLVALHVSDGAVDAGAAGRVVELAVGRARSEHPGLAVSAEVASGNAAEVLASRSSGACLLVLGHRAHHGPGQSSVATRVMHAAQVPVIVYRPLDTAAVPPLPRPVLVRSDGRVQQGLAARDAADREHKVASPDLPCASPTRCFGWRWRPRRSGCSGPSSPLRS